MDLECICRVKLLLLCILQLLELKKFQQDRELEAYQLTNRNVLRDINGKQGIHHQQHGISLQHSLQRSRQPCLGTPRLVNTMCNQKLHLLNKPR
jgi:hypothetical protein